MVVPAKKKPKGFVCPNCAIPLKVGRTTRVVGGTLRRQECPQCGAEAHTSEVVISLSPSPGVVLAIASAASPQ